MASIFIFSLRRTEYYLLSRHHTTDSRLSMAPCYSPPAAHQKSIARVACWSSSDEPLKQAGRQGQPPTLHASASPRVAFIPAVLARRTKLLCRGPWADPARPLPPLFSISIFSLFLPDRRGVTVQCSRTASGQRLAVLFGRAGERPRRKLPLRRRRAYPTAWLSLGLFPCAACLRRHAVGRRRRASVCPSLLRSSGRIHARLGMPCQCQCPPPASVPVQFSASRQLRDSGF
jgi:hypothetical protein